MSDGYEKNGGAVGAPAVSPSSRPRTSRATRGRWPSRTVIVRRLGRAVSGDAGMSTVEYAVGTVAAAAFGAVLYTVVTGGSIPEALGAIIERALSSSV